MNQTEAKDVKPIIHPGFRNLILIVTFLLVFLMASRSPLDSDLWWHLQSGRVMAESGKPLLIDSFSYTRDGQDWVNHSWLGDVALYAIYQVSGWTGLSAWMGCMAVLIAVLLWLQISGGIYTIAGFILLTSIACAPLWTPRPQFFSLLLLTFLTWLINSWLKKGGRIVWISIPLFILWSNLHGGYMLGILFLIACSVGLGLDAVLLSQMERKKELRQAGVLLAMAAGGYLSAAINPNGYRMWLIPFQTVGVGILRQFIQEWASPDFHSMESWAFAFFVVFLVFCLARKTEKTPFRFIIPSLLFLLMALYARRNMAAAAVIATPMLVGAWNNLRVGEFLMAILPQSVRDLMTQYKEYKQSELSETKKKVFNLLFAGLLSFFCFVKLAAVTHPTLMDAFETKFYPKAAVQFMAVHGSLKEGRIFNAYNWGGYLVWKDPKTKVFVDGRTDLFGDEILGEWLIITQAGDCWQKLIDKWNITRIIIEPDRPLATALLSLDWEERFRDSQSVIFDRKSP